MHRERVPNPRFPLNFMWACFCAGHHGHRRIASRLLYGFCALLFCASLWGCSESGPQRYPLSGSITYGGKPVPSGKIDLQPNTPNQPVTRQTFSQAVIKDGRYETKVGMGIIGGPHLLIIACYDGKDVSSEKPYGSSLRSLYRMEIELPHGPSTQDIEVPIDRQGNTR